MKFASFRGKDKETWGIIDDEKAYDIGDRLRARYPSLKALIAAHAYSEAQAAKSTATAYPTEEIDWLPVIPNPDKIFCVGLNYETHRKETGRAVVTHPTIFGRFANSQTAHLRPIVRPRVSTDLDFEGELAVIIGQPGRYIPQAEAFEHVAGYA
jgi:2-keto-4-pentenoate hydratase/2-oxohepta-3-ene-1,7-dioic acid hydratase in catechol pathway